ncbi:MAG: MMPL family transporter [Flavobacteriaceae bacterium]|nr:MMPL family transporter [Flavobacteriaceae bacterium]
MNFFRKLINFILKFRLVIGIAFFSLCAYSIFLIFSQLKVDNSLSIWFLEDDKEYLEYLEFQKEQGSDEIIVVMISTENAFSKKHIKTLNNLHQKIDSIENINATFSLAKAKYPIFANNKMYLKNVITDKRSERAITNLLKKLPAIRDNLLADNNTKSFFFIQLKSFSEIEENRDELLLKIKTVINSELNDYKITGSPILVEEINKSVAKETLIFAIVTGLIIILLLLIVLPKISYLPIALAVVVVPITLLFGLYVALGYKLNMISMLIPTILMVYSVSDIIHIINIHYLHVQKHPNQTINEQIIEALYKSLKPCFYTTITTIIGYLALYISPLPVFKTTGIFSFIGLLIAFISAYIIAAIGFRFLIFNHIKKTKPFSFNWIDVDAIIHRINHTTTHYKKTILITASLLFFIGVSSIFFIDVNSYSLNLLHNGKAKEDLKEIEKTLLR